MKIKNKLIFLLIFILVIGLDLYLKDFAKSHFSMFEHTVGPLSFFVRSNQGFIGGSFSSLPVEIIRVISSAFGALLTICFFMIQNYLPSGLFVLRLGVLLFYTGIVGNLIEKVLWKRVTDFISISFTTDAGVFFNFADVVQVLGILLVIIFVILKSEEIFFRNDQRTKLWINKEQVQVLKVFQALNFSFFFLTWISARVFLVEMIRLQTISVSYQTKYAFDFMFLCLYIICSLLLTLVVQVETHRIYGPVVNLKNFINRLMTQNLEETPNQITLRKNDKMKDLIELSREIKSLIKKD